MESQVITDRRQQGLSLVGFIFVIAIVALIAVLGMKVVPTVVEYVGVKKAITAAKNAGSTPAEIRASFDKQADTGYIESVSGKDLQITKTNDGFDVGVAYEKRIALIGPASLVIDYVAGTGVTSGNKAEQ
jgi:Tfp pilus assembly major pilin PilA